MITAFFPVIFLCDGDLRPFLVRACVLGMCNGDYLFLYASVELRSNYDWNVGEPDDEIVKQAYKYLIMVSQLELSYLLLYFYIGE